MQVNHLLYVFPFIICCSQTTLNFTEMDPQTQKFVNVVSAKLKQQKVVSGNLKMMLRTVLAQAVLEELSTLKALSQSTILIGLSLSHSACKTIKSVQGARLIN
jgi:hypothetical protein